MTEGQEVGNTSNCGLIRLRTCATTKLNGLVPQCTELTDDREKLRCAVSVSDSLKNFMHNASSAQSEREFSPVRLS